MSILNETAEILRLYFIQQQELSLNGIGRFDLVRKPALFNEASGVFSAPEFTIVFHPENAVTSKELIVYLSKKKNISEPEAIAHLKDFNKELLTRLQAGEAVQWAGIGSLFIKNEQIECIPDLVELPFLENISTVRHEPQPATTSVEPQEATQEEEIYVEEELPKAKKNIYLILLAVLAAGLILFSVIQQKRFTTHRTTVVSPAVTPEQYQLNSAE